MPQPAATSELRPEASRQRSEVVVKSDIDKKLLPGKPGLYANCD